MRIMRRLGVVAAGVGIAVLLSACYPFPSIPNPHCYHYNELCPVGPSGISRK